MVAKKRVTKSTVAKNVKIARAPRGTDRRVVAAEDKATAFGATVRTSAAKGFGVALGAATFTGAVAFAVSRGLFRGIRG